MKPLDFTPPRWAVPAHTGSQAMLARVVDVVDPLGLARIKVEIYPLDTDRDAAVWARVAAPFAGDARGAFFLPQPDDEVLVIFAGGDARAPIIIGGLWNGSAKPPEEVKGEVNRWSITGKAGTRIAIIEEGPSEVRISTPGGCTWTLTDQGGGQCKLECAGNTVTVEPAGITVQASAKVKIEAAQVEVSAALVKVDAAMSKFSGVVQCDVLISNSVVSAAYTPGAGNIW